ncbi:hypothetical protein Goklo_013696, partial [Gossypium klotzschianum]|nr:hypothetical protein [Gossypium klotzschianum]
MMITTNQGMVMVVVVVELVNVVAELETAAIQAFDFLCMQKMASDFLAKYIFMAMNRVGSGTGLIVQRVEFFHESEERSHRTDTFFMLRKQMVSKA